MFVILYNYVKLFYLHDYMYNTADRDTVDAVLRLVLNQISEDMFVLPVSVCVMFKALEAECKTKGMKTPHHCVGTKVSTK